MSLSSGRHVATPTDQPARVRKAGPFLVAVVALLGAIGFAAPAFAAAPYVVSVAVSPATPTIPLGLQQLFTATATMSDASTQAVQTPASWSSDTPGVLTIDANGVATTVSQGTATVSVTASGIVGSTLVTVGAPFVVSVAVSPNPATIIAGGAQHFDAVATLSDGTTTPVLTPAAYSSSDPGVASIDANGDAIGLSAGSTTISVSADGIVGTAALDVTAAVPTGLEVTPDTASIAKGLTQQFTAVESFSDGSTVDVSSTASWSSDGPSVTVDTHGLATGAAVGAATVTATIDTFTDSSSITVTPPYVVSVAVTPSPASTPKGTSLQMTGTATFTDGHTEVVQSPGAWASSNPVVATIDDHGLAAGLTEGTTTISVSASGIVGSVTLTVGPAVPVSLVVTPANPSVAKGLPQQFTATATLTDGTTGVDVTSSVIWSSGTPAVASINAAGKASTLAVGTSTITATAGSVNASTTLTVTPATIVSASIQPSSGQIQVGQTGQVHEVAVYTDGSTSYLDSVTTFTSSDPTVATVNAAGQVTGLKVGTTQIKGHTAGYPDSLSTVTVIKGDTHLSNPDAIRKSNGFSANVTYSTTLTDVAGHPIAGKTVHFFAVNANACDATTNAVGFATCTHVYSLLLSTPAPGVGAHYLVQYAGDSNYRDSSNIGTVAAG